MSECADAHSVAADTSRGMRWIPGRAFRMGAEQSYPEEAPVHTVTVSGFWMDEYAVTNEDFAAFVAATDYRTIAERPLAGEDLPTEAEWEFAVYGGLGGSLFFKWLSHGKGEPTSASAQHQSGLQRHLAGMRLRR